MSKRKRHPQKMLGLYDWYSVCSKHYYHDPTCNMCESGMWIFRPRHAIVHWFIGENHQRTRRYRFFKPIWLKYVNHPKRKHKIFGGLKKRNA